MAKATPLLRASICFLLGVGCGGSDGGQDDGAGTSVATSTAGDTSTGTMSSASSGASTLPPGESSADTVPSTTDGPGPDTGVDDGDSSTTAAGVGCGAGDFVVCEDFEGAAVGGFPDGWDLRASGVYGGNGMGATDEDAALGSQSLRVDGGSTGAQWLAYQGDISAFADGHWGRMAVKIGMPVPWPAGGVIHGDLVEARGNWEGSTHQVRWAAIENDQMLHNWGYNVQTSNAGEFIHETSYVYAWPADWFCLEWHHDRVAQSATLWVDGQEVLAVTAADDPQMPVFDDISVGWANYQPADPQFVVFIDEVVLDEARVGCP